MCGRFGLVADRQQLEARFGLVAVSDAIDLRPRYNIAPGQSIPIVRHSRSRGGRLLDAVHWGLVPPWSSGPNDGPRAINARAETAASKPAFRRAWRQRRGLVPATGFYEWKQTGGKAKQPYLIHCRAEDEADLPPPFAMAALWETWTPDDDEQGPDQGRSPKPLLSAAILTTEPNSLLVDLHDRMPVILPPDAWDRWLDPDTDTETLQRLMRPAPESMLAMHPVSTRVNNPKQDDPELMQPAPSQGSLF